MDPSSYISFFQIGTVAFNWSIMELHASVDHDDENKDIFSTRVFFEHTQKTHNINMSKKSVYENIDRRETNRLLRVYEVRIPR